MNYSAPIDLLAQRVILVTGAANGIGAAVAKAYARHGATVVLLDKVIPALEAVYDDIVSEQLAQPAIYPLDLKGANINDYQTLVESIKDNFGRLDGLVHCAATLGQLAPVEHQDPVLWLETLHINLTAPYLLTQACLPLLKQQSSSIIFTTEQNANKAYWSAHGIAKAGIETLSQQLADELENGQQVRVNRINPGRIDTALFAQAFPAINPNALLKPEDITPPYLYLMGDDSAHVNNDGINAQ